MQCAYLGSQNTLYAGLTGASLLTAIAVKATNKLNPMTPLLLAGVSLGAIASISMYSDGMKSLATWLPAMTFSVANFMRYAALGRTNIWSGMSQRARNILSGENFAAVGVGMIALFAAGPENTVTTISTSLAVMSSLALTTLQGREDRARIVLGCNALLAAGSALMASNMAPAIANIFTACASASLVYHIRQQRALTMRV